MKAVVLEGYAPIEQSPLRLVDAREPQLTPGHVIIDVEACGVCRTDLHIAEGEVRGPLPITPGHQVAGRVAAVAPDVSNLRAGDLVGVGWLAVPDEIGDSANRVPLS